MAQGTVRVFGLGELEALAAKQRKPHLPTLQSVLEVLGIANVAEQEANEAAKKASDDAAAADREAERLSQAVATQRTIAEGRRNSQHHYQDLANVAKKMTGK